VKKNDKTIVDISDDNDSAPPYPPFNFSQESDTFETHKLSKNILQKIEKKEEKKVNIHEKLEEAVHKISEEAEKNRIMDNEGNINGIHKNDLPVKPFNALDEFQLSSDESDEDDIKLRNVSLKKPTDKEIARKNQMLNSTKATIAVYPNLAKISKVDNSLIVLQKKEERIEESKIDLRATEKNKKVELRKNRIYDENCRLIPGKINYPGFIPNLEYVTRMLLRYHRRDRVFIEGLKEVLLKLLKFYSNDEYKEVEMNFPICHILELVDATKEQIHKQNLSRLKIRAYMFEDFNFKLAKDYVRNITDIDKDYPKLTKRNKRNYNWVIEKLHKTNSEDDLPKGEKMRIIRETYQSMRDNLIDLNVSRGRKTIRKWIEQCLKAIESKSQYAQYVSEMKRQQETPKPCFNNNVGKKNKRRRDKKANRKRFQENRSQPWKKYQPNNPNVYRWQKKNAYSRYRNYAPYIPSKGHGHECRCDINLKNRTGKIMICTDENCDFQCRDHKKCHENCSTYQCEHKCNPEACHFDRMRVYIGCLRREYPLIQNPYESIEHFIERQYACPLCYSADVQSGKIDPTRKRRIFNRCY
jgi:hypothetical protein